MLGEPCNPVPINNVINLSSTPQSKGGLCSGSANPGIRLFTQLHCCLLRSGQSLAESGFFDLFCSLEAAHASRCLKCSVSAGALRVIGVEGARRRNGDYLDNASMVVKVTNVTTSLGMDGPVSGLRPHHAPRIVIERCSDAGHVYRGRFKRVGTPDQIGSIIPDNGSLPTARLAVQRVGI
jgi:hypothetical protein